MPNPFPGMNPYLESPLFWPGFHSGLVNAIADSLNAVLPEGFVADVEERLYILHPLGERQTVPDVLVSARSAASPPPDGTNYQHSGGVAVAAPPGEEPVVIWAEPREVREPFVQVLSLASEGRIISTIELLSPSNKAAGSAGRRKYRTKQQTLINSDAHFLEIDLLRGGLHTLHVDRETLAFARNGGAFDYAACLHRSGSGYGWEVWTRTLREPLPHALLVPLTNGLPDAAFDLQALVNRVYDARRYSDRIDYQGQPAPPLAPADKEWADELLRQKNLRPSINQP